MHTGFPHPTRSKFERSAHSPHSQALRCGSDIGNQLCSMRRSLLESLQHCLKTLYHYPTDSTHPLHLSDSQLSSVRPVPRIFVQLDYIDRHITTSPSSNAKRVLWNESVRCTRVSPTHRAARLNARHIPPFPKCHFGGQGETLELVLFYA